MDTLWQLLEESSERFADRTALQMRRGYRTVRLTYRELAQASLGVAAHLETLGLKQGDRVLMLGPNSPEWVTFYFGCMRAGIVLVPLDVRSSPDFMTRVALVSDAKCLIVSSFASDQAPEVGIPTHVLEDLVDKAGTVAGSLSMPEPNENDIAEIMFTSGTTGDPKGVILTHRNIVSNVKAAYQYVPAKPDYNLLSILPLSHMLEQTAGLLIPLMGGSKVVYAASRQPKTIFNTLKEERITTLVAVPQVFELFWSGIEREVANKGKQATFKRMLGIASSLPIWGRRLVFRSLHKALGGNLRFVMAGGARLDPELARNWELIGIPVLQGFGTTETAPIITSSRIGDRDFDSLGKPLPGVDVRIEDDGEILVRGANVMQGYWQNPKATEEVLSDGWYKTGDLGELDAKGHLRLKGRKKDVIVLDNGMNVHAQDVEQEVKRQADVKDAAVVGLPSRNGRVEVHAVILLEESVKSDAAKGIVAKANERLGEHQRVGGFTVWPEDDLPRTHTLKVKKQEVLHRLTEGFDDNGSKSSEGESSADDDEVPHVHRIIAEASSMPISSLSSDSALGDDLGLDSLRRVEVLAAIEDETGVYLDESQVTEETTVGDLTDLVANADSEATKPHFPEWPRKKVVRWLGTGSQTIIALPVLSLVMPTKTEGRLNIESVDGPVIFAANHLSHLDTAAVMKALPLSRRANTTVAAAADTWFDQKRFSSWTASFLFNVFPFSRTSAVRPSLEHMSKLIANGWSVLIYPEGTRSVTGRLGPLKSGTGMMAVEMGVPVVPIRIEGTFEVLAKDQVMPKRHHVNVRIGEAFRFAAGTSYDLATVEIADALRGLGQECVEAEVVPVG